jgi:hypothetical protein
MKFNSQIQKLGNFKHDWLESIVKNEPMFFNCDFKFAYENGGPITKQFLEQLPSSWKDTQWVLDSRVHMLMPNWYPCIPGWHHDDVPRSTSTGQPNYTNPEYHAEHLMGLVNAEICPTTFRTGEIEVSDPDINTGIYNVWNSEIEAGLNPDSLYEAESGKYIQFDANAFHTGIKARKGGWRWFIRLSRNTDRTNKITNEIRRQVQVYLDEPMAGW